MPRCRLALILGGRDERVANVIAHHPSIAAPTAPNHTFDAVEHAARMAAPVMVLHATLPTPHPILGCDQCAPGRAGVKTVRPSLRCGCCVLTEGPHPTLPAPTPKTAKQQDWQD